MTDFRCALHGIDHVLVAREGPLRIPATREPTLVKVDPAGFSDASGRGKRPYWAPRSRAEDCRDCYQEWAGTTDRRHQVRNSLLLRLSPRSLWCWNRWAHKEDSRAAKVRSREDWAAQGARKRRLPGTSMPRQTCCQRTAATPPRALPLPHFHISGGMFDVRPAHCSCPGRPQNSVLP